MKVKFFDDPTKAKQKLGLVPEYTEQANKQMVAKDLVEYKQHALLKENGYQVKVSVEYL
jgi:GDPmannose 4,6-dehydratase